MKFNYEMRIFTLSCLFLCFLLNSYSAAERLNDYILHYDELSYDTATLHNSHTRAKRSTDGQTHVTLRFTALGRNFHLRLRRDTSTFSKDLQLQLADGSLVDHDTSYIYEGEVKGEPGSRVHGSIIDGIFAGRIHTSSGAYFVDKSEIYFREKQPFHSVIYHEKHVENDPYRSKRSLEDAHCGSVNEGVAEWMQSVQNSAVNKKTKRSMKASSPASGHHNPYTMYSAAANRARRNTNSAKMCTLFLQTDPELWKYMTDERRGLGYGSTRAREEITSLLADHVTGIKSIYIETQFSDVHRGYSFVVRRMQIMDDSLCDSQEITRSRFCEPNIDVTNFLNLNSLTNHNDYCLAYMFTYRDFTGGTLGLAWVGANSRAAGGICEKWKEYKENGQTVWKSLNTGIVTFVNYGSRVPPKVSTLTFAHEVGHNFGSPHDRTADCTPYTSSNDAGGNYIMFASATSGDRPNNRRFSECSKDSIAAVLEAVVTGAHGKENCLVDSDEAFCGNGIVEGEDEECDCGYQEDCMEICCNGRRQDPPAGYQECKRIANASCSPSEGPCCTDDCGYIGADTLTCAADSDCTFESKCNGMSPICPAPEHKENNTLCNEKTQICQNGECVGSVCTKIGWDQCYLTAPEDDKNFDKGNLCYASCKNPSSDDNPCVSSGDKDMLNKAENADFKALLEEENLFEDGIRLPPGAPCDYYKGYCDVFSKCRGVDADGPLAKLKKLFFSSETYDTIRRWVTVHWWAVMLMGIGLILGMGAFIAVCAVHTPSSNPNRKPARRVSDTLRRRPRQPARGPPPGYGGGGNSSRPPPYNPRSQNYEMKGKKGQRV